MLKADPMADGGKRAPYAGEVFRNPTLANTFRLVAERGKKGFYEGPVAEALVKVVKDLGGYITMEDLKEHAELGTQDTEAISLKFRGQNIGNVSSQDVDGTDDEDKQGVEIWEHPPNGQGLVALMALGILEELERTGKIRKFAKHEHNCPEYLHAVIESLRIAFADGSWWIADPDVEKVPVAQLISRPYLASRAALFDPARASPILDHGSPAHNHCDTTYFAVADAAGNGMSFIISNYAGFGTGIVPAGCGFTLQNRGSNFALHPEGHPNAFAPRKRPYHTIIPALTTNPRDGSLHAVYGVMGGFMQPQGHVQVLLNMLAFGLSPQAALDAPRVCIGAGMPDEAEVLDRTVYLEDGIAEPTATALKRLGHRVQIVDGHDRALFGRGQVIRCQVQDGRRVYHAGSDMRGDGAAFPV